MAEVVDVRFGSMSVADLAEGVGEVEFGLMQ
jgi:hypothetical protein